MGNVRHYLRENTFCALRWVSYDVIFEAGVTEWHFRIIDPDRISSNRTSERARVSAWADWCNVSKRGHARIVSDAAASGPAARPQSRATGSVSATQLLRGGQSAANKLPAADLAQG